MSFDEGVMAALYRFVLGMYEQVGCHHTRCVIAVVIVTASSRAHATTVCTRDVPLLQSKVKSRAQPLETNTNRSLHTAVAVCLLCNGITSAQKKSILYARLIALHELLICVLLAARAAMRNDSAEASTVCETTGKQRRRNCCCANADATAIDTCN